MVNTYYYEVVMTNVLDMVPKTIMLNMVYQTTGPKYATLGTDNLGVHLFEFLNTRLQEDAVTMLAEPDDIAFKRQTAEEAVKVRDHRHVMY